MAHRFKIWDQGNDGNTMAIRVENMHALRRLAQSCTAQDIAGNYGNLQEYIVAASRANTPPLPYPRFVDVVWLNMTGYDEYRYFPHRTLVVTYSGNRRQNGGFASQGYCIIDPNGYPHLAAHHRSPILVEYVANTLRDALVVLDTQRDSPTSRL